MSIAIAANTDSTESVFAEVPAPADKVHYAEFVEEPQEESPIDEIVDQIQDAIDPASDVAKKWMDSIIPLLSQGGKPVALILALGAISIPLAMTGSASLAYILAGGAVAVAMIVAMRSKNI